MKSEDENLKLLYNHIKEIQLEELSALLDEPDLTSHIKEVERETDEILSRFIRSRENPNA